MCGLASGHPHWSPGFGLPMSLSVQCVVSGTNCLLYHGRLCCRTIHPTLTYKTKFSSGYEEVVHAVRTLLLTVIRVHLQGSRDIMLNTCCSEPREGPPWRTRMSDGADPAVFRARDRMTIDAGLTEMGRLGNLYNSKCILIRSRHHIKHNGWVHLCMHHVY